MPKCYVVCLCTLFNYTIILQGRGYCYCYLQKNKQECRELLNLQDVLPSRSLLSQNHVVNILFTLPWRECDALSACCSFTSLLKKAGDPGPGPRVTTACPGHQHLVKGSHPLSDHSPCWSLALESQQTPLSYWAVTGLNRSLLLGSQLARGNRGRDTAEGSREKIMKRRRRQRKARERGRRDRARCGYVLKQ